MTGFRFPLKSLKGRLAKVREGTRADAFRDDIVTFSTDSLQTAVRITPVRQVSIITDAQRKQFTKRARYIRENPGSATRSVTQSQFIEERAQARFLYRRSWMQVCASARLRVSVSPAVSRAVTRRRNPVAQPPRGYAQWRGGAKVLSLVIFNPFLNIPSRYKTFNAQTILDRAMAVHRPAFKKAAANRVRREIYAASR